MANLNKTLCNCEGFYNEETQMCDPLLPNSPNPCPTTFWGNVGDLISTNVHIGGYSGGGGVYQGGSYFPAGSERKDNTMLYIGAGIVVLVIIWFMMKKKK